MSDEKHSELLALISELNEASAARVKEELFKFIRQWWKEIGESIDVQDAVCSKLHISRTMFGIYLNQPELVHGMEVNSCNIKAGWLRNYIDYTSGSEAPEDFHLWVGLTILGAVLRRKVWYDNVYYNLYPNLFTILLAPPGVGKKTTAISIGVNILRSACPELKIFSEKATPEALANRLGKPVETVGPKGLPRIETRCEALITAPELTTFLGRERYNEPMVDLLTRLYDSQDFETSTISRKVESLKNIFICLLGATTPTKIIEAIPSSASGGGLMSRLNIIQKDFSTRTMPEAIAIDPTMKELVISELARIDREVHGAYAFTEDGRKWYHSYYRNWKKLIERNAYSGANIERQADHVLKVAIIMAVSEGKKDLDEDVLQRSYNILTVALRNTGDVIRLIDSTEKGRLMELVITTLKKFGGMCTQSQLIHRLHRQVDKNELRVLVETLNDAKILDTKLAKDGRTVIHRLVYIEEPVEEDPK